jgi:predicted phage tail protein
MRRTVYFEGDLAKRYGESISVSANSASDIVRLIQANDPSFKNYVTEAAEKGIEFSLQVQNKSVKEQDLILPLEKGDVYFSAIPSGSKSGGGKLLAALAIASLFMIPGGAILGSQAAATTGTASAGLLGSTTVAGVTTLNMGGQILAGLAVNLAITGIQQLMAPDPSTDEGPESYLYNADNQNIVEGDPVPLAYGRVKVPGRAISFSVMNKTTYDSTAYSFASGLETGIPNFPEESTAASTSGTVTASDSDGSINSFPMPNIGVTASD